MTGKVRTIKFDKAFGFITGSDNKDYFFHRSACDDAEWMLICDQYNKGVEAEVEFDEGMGPKGKRAENVRML